MQALGKTSIYISQELAKLIDETKRITGEDLTAKAITTALKRFTNTHRKVPEGLKRIAITGRFEGKDSFERRVFTGRWVIPPSNPMQLPEDYAAAISGKGNWIVLFRDPVTVHIEGIDGWEIRTYETLDQMKDLPTELLERLASLQEETEWEI